MKRFQLHLQGQHESLTVELGCSGVEQLAELAGSSRFVIGHLDVTDECGCQPKVMIAAARISCAIELS
ncbi:MAG: hypothetical protein ACKO1N_03270 [Erythrobacter sp.]